MNHANYFLKIKFADLFLLSSLFPFVNFNITNFDTQPFTFLLGLVGLFLSYLSLEINKSFRASFILVLIALFVSAFVLQGQTYYLIRGFFNYISFFFYLFIFAFLFKKKLINEKLIIFSNYLYIFFGLVQIVSPGIIEIFVKPRINYLFFTGRGLTSLTPEPSHFGVILILLSMLVFINSGFDFRKNIRLYVLNLFSIFFLSRSSSILLILIINLTFIFIFNIHKFLKFKYLKYFLLGLLFLFIGIFYTMNFDTRTSRILGFLNFQNFRDSIFYLINIDGSISERLQHILVPIIALFKDFGAPHSFVELSKTARIINSELNIFNISTSSINLMSFLGDWFFTLGIFGVVALFLIFIPILFQKNSFQRSLVIGLIVLLLTSVPISLPLVPAVIAAFYYRNSNFFNSKLKI